MKQKIIEKILIPDDIESSVENNRVILRFNNKENFRRFNFYGIELKKDGNEILIESKRANKKELKIVFSTISHIKNMIKGLKDGFEYKLEIAFVHFPINIEYDKANHKLIIKNFLGEKKNRIAETLPDVDVEINKNIILLKSHNIESAGQTAANIEKATHVKNRDRRKFQDGIYIIKKPKGEM